MDGTNPDTVDVTATTVSRPARMHLRALVFPQRTATADFRAFRAHMFPQRRAGVTS
jgi:hypothetical protein